MKNTLSDFLNYLHIEKYTSPFSVYNYRLELEKNIGYLQSNNIDEFSITK